MNLSSRRFNIVCLLYVCVSNGYRTRRDPCFLQSFSQSSLTYLSTRTELPLVLLVMETVTDSNLKEWRRSQFYGLGVWINVLTPHWTIERGHKNWIASSGPNSDLVSRAHSCGLKVRYGIITTIIIIIMTLGFPKQS